MKKRRPYPTDVSDEEWYFAAPYLTLMNKDAPQRRSELRGMFNALRWIVRTAITGTTSTRLPFMLTPLGYEC
jgi:transposase